MSQREGRDQSGTPGSAERRSGATRGSGIQMAPGGEELAHDRRGRLAGDRVAGILETLLTVAPDPDRYPGELRGAAPGGGEGPVAAGLCLRIGRLVHGVVPGVDRGARLRRIADFGQIERLPEGPRPGKDRVAMRPPPAIERFLTRSRSRGELVVGRKPDPV